MMSYLTTGPFAVYRGTNSCPVPDFPFKGILMMKCVASDPVFRQNCKLFKKKKNLTLFSRILRFIRSH